MPKRYSLHATVDHFFGQKRSLLVAQGLHEDVDQNTQFSAGESSFVSSVVASAKKKPFNHDMSQIHVSHLRFVQDPILSESCPDDYLSPPRHPLYRVAPSYRASLPQSETQGFDKHEDVCKVTSVLHSYLHAQQTFSPDSCFHTSDLCPFSATAAVLFHRDVSGRIPFPGQFAQSRRDFESPIERHDILGQRQIEEDDDQDITDFDNQELPAFVDDLTQHFLSLNFDVYDADFEIPVRTWYIDHATIRRWTAPRILQLTGPPDSWGGQIVALWIDQIDTDAWFDISVVQPDPPRTLRYAYVMFDLIVTQTFSLERYAGLVTVIPDQVGSFELFSVACSFEQYVSGIDVVLAADASSYCRYQACRITQRWEELPYNFRPQHAMANGDSFHITVRNAPPILAQPASSSSGASSSTDRPPQSQVSTSVELPGRMNQFMTPLHLFQLQGHEVITQLVNAQLVQPSHEIAHALNVPFHALEALHLVPVRPADMSEMTIAAVVQRTGDIPQRSTDRLLLMDVIYHLHPAPEGRTNHPRIVRTVERVGHLVTRNQLLLTAGVFHYCAFLNDVCTVHLDEVLWLLDDRNVRPIRHGSYARIDLPPPAEFPVDTQTAANSVLEAQTELTQDYFFPPSEPDDDVNLMQKTCRILKPVSSTEQHRQPPVCIDSATDISQGPMRSDRFHLDAEPIPLEADVSVSTKAGAVLRPKADLNPCLTEPHPLQKLPANTSASRPKTKKERSRLSKENTSNQSKITTFFRQKQACTETPFDATQNKRSAVSEPSAEPKAKVYSGETSPQLNHQQQTCIETPFDVIGTQRSVVSEPSAEPLVQSSCRDLPTTSSNTDTPKDGVVEHKVEQQQQPDPPTWTTSTAAQRHAHGHNLNPRPRWLIDLSARFDELATIRHPATGPELEVDVWYVHHVRHPECTAPRTVRLDDIRELWYADLCAIWWDQVDTSAPVRIDVVTPTPAYVFRPHASIHLILVQGQRPGRVALHFTAVFHGGPRKGLFQRAESVPDRIHTQMMIEKHNFQSFCSERLCKMWSGRLRFLLDEAEEIFSGISVILHIGDHRSTTTEASSTNGTFDQVTLMQTSAIAGRPTVQRWPGRTQLNHNELPPQAPELTANAANAADQPPADTIAVAAPPAQAGMPQEGHHCPAIAVHDPLSVRQALLWQVQNERGVNDDGFHQVTVHSWFLDPQRFHRSDHPRAVVLSPHPMHWVDDLVSRWRDWLLPDFPVHIHLVQPHPLSGSGEVCAHVILVQRPQRTSRAALVSITEMLDDPWNPTPFSILLPLDVTYEQLLDEATVSSSFAPLEESVPAQITHGSIDILPGTSFPVRNGFHFQVAIASLDPEVQDATIFLQLGFYRLVNTIKNLQASIERPIPIFKLMHHEEPAPLPISTTVVPPLRAGTPANPFEFLTFHSTLQSLWQPLSILGPPGTRPIVPVITWYIDHIRYPQCFEPREVQLSDDPQEWTHHMRQAWHDVVNPHQALHFHLVQPHPVDHEVRAAAHVILVQQRIDPFDSVLISLFDSAWPGFPPQRHASMTPHHLPYHTLLGLAYRDRDCAQAHNTCTAWKGNTEITPDQVVQVFDGASLTVAIHRHIFVQAPDEADIWGDQTPSLFPNYKAYAPDWPRDNVQEAIASTALRANPPSLDEAYTSCHDRLLQQRLHQVFGSHRPLPAPATKHPSARPVVLSLQAVLPEPSPTLHDDLNEDVSALAWFQQSHWKDHCLSYPPTPSAQLPEGLIVPPVSYNALLQPPLSSDPATWEWELYVDGSQSACQAGWSVVIVCKDAHSSCFCGCHYGQVQTTSRRPDWIGADSKDNIAAELTAFIVAQDIVFRSLPARPSTIRPDLLLSKMIATYETITKASPHLAQVCRILSSWLGPDTSVRPVAAHQGHPWNELADSLAKWAAIQDSDDQPTWLSA